MVKQRVMRSDSLSWEEEEEEDDDDDDDAAAAATSLRASCILGGVHRMYVSSSGGMKATPTAQSVT